ncbi:GDCCVxC domain-containing (seleno)protein [Nitrosomonas communis]|uniref:GDCCVxC domain-containing (seleno)protein n=1 Tax=Nitrosomonas communis TaxID=44574 RepID=UPI003D2C17CA
MIGSIIFESDLTCPYCGFIKREAMSINSCQYFYKCGALLRPKPGNCCVFCSYGTVKCILRQTKAG